MFKKCSQKVPKSVPKNVPTKFAKNLKIPLVIYGESPSEYGSPTEEYTSDYVVDWHTCNNYDEIFISGESFKTLKSFGLKEFDLCPFLPLTKDEFIKHEIKCLAFSYFRDWHPQANYYYAIENSNFNLSPEIEEFLNSVSERLDDQNTTIS